MESVSSIISSLIEIPESFKSETTQNVICTQTYIFIYLGNEYIKQKN